jgi:DMSO/TMAO reductase YedYZ molybdopterin-dependent catalytic subunit
VTRKYAAFAGVAAAALALGAGELIAAVVGARSAPLVAVGGAVIDSVPESGKEFAIQLFGIHDKIALQIGTVVVLGAIAAALGILAARRLWIGLVGIGAFTAVGVVAALTRTGAESSWALPALLGGVASGLSLWALLRLGAGIELTLFAAREHTRRQFLGAAGVALGSAAVFGYLGRQFAQKSQVNSARAGVALPTPSGASAVAPASADVAGLAYATPNDTFYRIDTAIVVPRIDPAAWTLKIHGRVGNPMTLTFDDLLRRPMIERYVTLACVSNEVGGDLIGNARWLGVPVKELLDEARPDSAADQVVSRSVDGFTAGTPTALLMDGRDAMIAVAMNGEPLPIDHGFPARMVVPGVYGYVSATKWLAELELTTFADFDAYWIPRGWAQQAPIRTSSRIDRPRADSVISAGQYMVAGVAWAQHRGISKVQVRVDGGSWQDATLASVLSIDTWRLWSCAWDATPGKHTLTVRAYDNAGEVQTDIERAPAPDGATGHHEITLDVS